MSLLGPASGLPHGLPSSKPAFSLRSTLFPQTGTNLPLLTCLIDGFSGVAEPAFQLATPGETVVDGLTLWTLQKKNATSSNHAWASLKFYRKGQKVSGTVPFPAGAGSYVLSTMRKAGRKVVPVVTPSGCNIPAGRDFLSRIRLAWLMRIWGQVLHSGDRAAWTSYATGYSIVNWDGTEKVYSGSELFVLCNQSIGLYEQSPLVDWIRYYAVLPPYASLGNYITMPVPVASGGPSNEISNVVDNGDGTFNVFPVATPPPDLTPGNALVYAYWTPDVNRADSMRGAAFGWVAWEQYSTPSYPSIPIIALGVTPDYFGEFSRPRRWTVGFRLQMIEPGLSIPLPLPLYDVPGPLFSFLSYF